MRGFNDLSCISNFKNLKNFLIEDNIQLESIKFDIEFPFLESLKILNCKKLNYINGINNLKVLKQIIISKTDVNFNSFINQNLPTSLSYVGFYTTKSKVDKEIKNKLVELGYKTR